MNAKKQKNEIQIIRVLDAPVRLVWEAWTDSQKVAQWWGPRGFSMTTHSKELKVGGIWHYTMHGPDGENYVNKTLYHEVEPYKRLVYDHGGNDERAPLFRVTVLFSETSGKTTMDMKMAFTSPEAAEAGHKAIKQANGHSTWDRLAEYLIEKNDGSDKFVINRSFEADIDTLYDMWTRPEHLAKWLPPVGFTMEFLKVEMKEGGQSHYVMSGHGIKMYGRAFYKKFIRPNCIVYAQQFCDEHGELSRHPHAPTWPASMLTTVTFASEGPKTTRVTIVWEIDGEATAEERQTFHQSKPGMTQGWTGSFDKLEDYLKAQ